MDKSDMDNSDQPKEELPELQRGESPETQKPQPEASATPERKLSEEELQKMVEEQIARIYDGQAGERVRNLCRIAVTWNVDAETYRRMLIHSGFRPARASEIKAVLMCEQECNKFLHGGPWKTALKNSRMQGDKDLRRMAARLLRLLWANRARFSSGMCGKWMSERDPLGQMRFTHPENGTFDLLNLIRTHLLQK